MLPVLAVGIYYLLMFSFVEWMHVRKGVGVERSRKTAHVLGGLVTLTFPFILEKMWQIVLLGALFTALLYVSKKYGWLRSIHQVKRASVGSVIFPVPIVICFAVFLQTGREMWFCLPLGVLVFCDTLAFIFGRGLKYRPYQVFGCDKTVGGSLAFLISAFFLSIAAFHFFGKMSGFSSWKIAATIAVCSTLVEAISPRGWDNLTAPLAVLGVLWFFG
jgi:phytol kinase